MASNQSQAFFSGQIFSNHGGFSSGIVIQRSVLNPTVKTAHCFYKRKNVARKCEAPVAEVSSYKGPDLWLQNGKLLLLL